MESLFPRAFGIVTDPRVGALEHTHGLAIAPVFELLSLFRPSALSFGTHVGAGTLAIDLWSGWKSPIRKILRSLLSKIHHAQSVLLPIFCKSHLLEINKVSGWIQQIICIVIHVRHQTMVGRNCLVFLVAICVAPG
jgi:hypothetical protein